MAFLTGFLLFLIRKVFYAIIRRQLEADAMLLTAYAMIGLGMLLLYLVPGEIAATIPSILVYFGLANGFAVAVLGLFLTESILELSKRKHLMYPGQALIRPLYAVSALGVVLTFGSISLHYALPYLPSDLTGWAVPTLGAVLLVAPLLAMASLEGRWRSGEPPSRSSGR